MPVVNMNKARVELSRDQFLGIVEHIHAKFSEREQVPPTIAIEETNLGNTVVVVGLAKDEWHEMIFLAYSSGEVHELKEG